MLRIKLVFRNGIHAGKHIVLHKAQFLIGRGEQADLRLNSNRISRHHCVICSREDVVPVEDPGSRNGVRLNDILIEPHQSYGLFHGDMIQVDEWLFKMSIRDEVSKKPLERRIPSSQIVRPTVSTSNKSVGLSGTSPAAEPNDSFMPKDVSALMGELDLLLNEVGQFANDPAGSRDKMKSSQAEQRSADPMDTKMDLGSTHDTIIDPVAIADTSEKTGETSVEVRQAIAGEPAEMRETESTADDKEEGVGNQDKTYNRLDKTHKRLPGHLRPKGPVDSVDAAHQALKRLFG